jgi:hypothetical protein
MSVIEKKDRLKPSITKDEEALVCEQVIKSFTLSHSGQIPVFIKDYHATCNMVWEGV